MAKLVSKVYGDALFSLALEDNRLDEVWDEVKTLSAALRENKEFTDIMTHPDMTQEKGLALLDEAFGGKHRGAKGTHRGAVDTDFRL